MSGIERRLTKLEAASGHTGYACALERLARDRRPTSHYRAAMV